jgi:hypothetical protein
LLKNNNLVYSQLKKRYTNWRWKAGSKITKQSVQLMGTLYSQRHKVTVNKGK